MKISRKKHWDRLYNSRKFDIKSTLKSLNSYRMKKLVLFLGKYIHKDSTKKFVEVGGAPGKYSLLFHKAFNYVPYAIDYSEPGIKDTQKAYEQLGVSRTNAILLDILDEGALRKYDDYFDIVFSAGFLEHFKDPLYILDLHLKILKNGGILIIMIPHYNLLGKVLKPFLSKDVLSQHNLSIMEIKEFSKIFISNASIKSKYLGYFGGVNLGVYGSVNDYLKLFLGVIQNFVERSGLEEIIPKNQCTSPYLMCIAEKCDITD